MKYGNELHYIIVRTFHLYTVSYNKKKYIPWESVGESEINKKGKSIRRM